MSSAKSVAATLLKAADEQRAVPCFTDSDDSFTTEFAYEAQDELIALRVAAGETVIGAKLGLTSRAKQITMNVDEPTYGWLTSGMLLQPDVALDHPSYLHPRAEPEIAFILERELTGPATVASVIDATGWICSAIEIIDSRYTDFRFTLPDVVADNSSAAGFLLGGQMVRPDSLGDMSLLGVVIRMNGEVIETAAGAAVLGHPAASVAWMVNRLHEKSLSLPAGSIILSGALTNALPVAPGASVDVEIEGLGHVGVRA